jgi:hypothetical protein
VLKKRKVEDHDDFILGPVSPKEYKEIVTEINVSGIHPGYSCKEGRIVEDGLLVEFPGTPTRTRSVYSY